MTQTQAVERGKALLICLRYPALDKEGLNLVLAQLDPCIQQGRYQSIETDSFEIKPVPAVKGDWDSIHGSFRAFLNKQGGMVLLGIKEEKDITRRFVFKCYGEDNAENIKRIRTGFTDRDGSHLDVTEYLNPGVQPFRNGQLAILRVSPVPEDK